MESLRKPEMVLSIAAIALAGGSAVYTNNKITALTQSLDKVVEQVNAVGKKVGEIRINELNENKEQLKNLTDSFRKLDRFTFQFRQEFDELSELQQFDNEAIQEFVNNVVKIAELESVEDLELSNVEDTRTKKSKKNKKKNVRFTKKIEESDDDEEDDVSSKLDKIRKKRR